jgi:hypothetical protein
MKSLATAAFAIGLTLLAPTAIAADDVGAFTRAIKQDNDLALRGLLSRGFNPNTPTENGNSGLYTALQEGSLKAASALLDSPKLKAESRTATDESPLMMAALKGQLDVAKRLIALDADVNKPGWTPLHYAATNGQTEMIRLLLEHHAFIDAQSPNGTTPLMMAASYGSPEAVKLLIESGADFVMRNQKQMSALDFAQRASRPDAVELLMQAERYRAQQRPGSKPQW